MFFIYNRDFKEDPPVHSNNPDQRFEEICESLHEMLLVGHPSPLSRADSANRLSGVYALYLDGELVYVGKATSLRTRLTKHRRTVLSSTLDVENVTFRTISLKRPLMTGFEEYLIAACNPPWNSTGFGSNAPGSGRAGQRRSEFSEKYGLPTLSTCIASTG